MALDFSRIWDRKVGYQIVPGGLYNHSHLRSLTFSEFIAPYAHDAESYDQVYGNLEKALDAARTEQASVKARERKIVLEVLVAATLEREALMNSMELIRLNYM